MSLSMLYTHTRDQGKISDASYDMAHLTSAKSACTSEGSRGLRRSWSTMEHLQNIRPSRSCMLVSCVSRGTLSPPEHSGGFRSSTIFMKLMSSQCSGVLWRALELQQLGLHSLTHL